MTNEVESDAATHFGRILFGRSLLRDEISEISPLISSRMYAPNEEILAEGSINELLFFLIEGSVAIVRSGETIAKLSTPGTLLGEMSIITRKVCSASTIALTPTFLIILELRKVHSLSSAFASRVTSALNLLFSVTLAEKLDSTNEKARLFEITNRELQIAKKALEAASTDKIGELAKNQQVVFRKLKSVLEEEIIPLREQLEKIEDERFHDASSRLQKIYAQVEPLVRNLKAESSLRNRRVLMVEDEINEQINAKMSLGGTGVDFTVIADPELAKAVIQEKFFDIICVNSNFVDLIAFAHAIHPDTKFVFLTSEPIETYFQTVLKHPELSTVLSRHPDDRTFTVRNIASTIRKLSGQDIFGMEKYLSWGTEVFEITVRSSEQRPEIIATLENYLDSIGVRGGLKRKSTRVAEELLMNAIYDAPTDASGKSLYNHIDRGNPLVLKPSEYATFRYACDGTFLAVSVVDPFGGLRRSTIINYLERCFNQEVGQSEIEGKGGGGNGLYQIIQSSSLTAFNVQPKVRTEVIALLNINIQMEKVATHPSFHYFETPSE